MIQGQTIELKTVIPVELSGKRLDQALAQLYCQYSRAQFQNWIKSGAVTIDGTPCTKARQIVTSDAEIEIRTRLTETTDWQAEALTVDIVHEDESLLVVNKAAGMVVHPGAGNTQHTLANALLHYHPALSQVPRAGVIHRLDKDTSGLLLIAKTPVSFQVLTDLMKNRAIKREYVALVKGWIIAGNTINTAIGRHPTQRTKMAVITNGREAITHYRVAEKFAAHTLLDVTLETGRTHQIRVHMESIGHPLVGDPQYRKAVALPAKLAPKQQLAIQQFKRQALHALRLSLPHPSSQKMISFESPLPEDLQSLLAILRKSP